MSKPRYWATEWVGFAGSGTKHLIDSAVESALCQIAGRILSAVNLVSVSTSSIVLENGNRGFYVTVLAEAQDDNDASREISIFSRRVNQLARMVRDHELDAGA